MRIVESEEDGKEEAGDGGDQHGGDGWGAAGWAWLRVRLWKVVSVTEVSVTETMFLLTPLMEPTALVRVSLQCLRRQVSRDNFLISENILVFGLKYFSMFALSLPGNLMEFVFCCCIFSPLSR